MPALLLVNFKYLSYSSSSWRQSSLTREFFSLLAFDLFLYSWITGIASWCRIHFLKFSHSSYPRGTSTSLISDVDRLKFLLSWSFVRIIVNFNSCNESWNYTKFSSSNTIEKTLNILYILCYTDSLWLFFFFFSNTDNTERFRSAWKSRRRRRKNDSRENGTRWKKMKWKLTRRLIILPSGRNFVPELVRKELNDCGYGTC